MHKTNKTNNHDKWVHSIILFFIYSPTAQKMWALTLRTHKKRQKIVKFRGITTITLVLLFRHKMKTVNRGFWKKLVGPQVPQSIITVLGSGAAAWCRGSTLEVKSLNHIVFQNNDLRANRYVLISALKNRASLSVCQGRQLRAVLKWHTHS